MTVFVQNSFKVQGYWEKVVEGGPLISVGALYGSYIASAMTPTASTLRDFAGSVSKGFEFIRGGIPVPFAYVMNSIVSYEVGISSMESRTFTC